MHTARTILLIVSTAFLGVLSVAAVAVARFGSAGLMWSAVVAATCLLSYAAFVRPWHRHWGATSAEIDALLPGDDLVPGASTTTRAVPVGAPPEDVWPWIVQIGFERAGWYSYDWIDNDGRPSADVVRADLQELEPGARILMTPDMGFVVRDVESGHHLVCLSEDGTTSWCLRLLPAPSGTSRLVSRFRARLPVSPATALWVAIADPGVFIMERKMLKGIARRAETRMRRQLHDARA
jgi:hypothetical protein